MRTSQDKTGKRRGGGQTSNLVEFVGYASDKGLLGIKIIGIAFSYPKPGVLHILAERKSIQPRRVIGCEALCVASEEVTLSLSYSPF